MTTPLIELRHVHKAFGGRKILDGVNLTIEKGQVTTIIGKSGVGKSVLLKHIIGLIRPDSGEILFSGQPLETLTRKQRKALKTKLAFMFQSGALFDSLTVFDNIALPLREKTRLSAAAIRERVMDKIRVLELPDDTVDKYPSQLSGGMQKRVALARALINDPEIVLFDEPTTGLDPIRKTAVLAMIAHYQRRFGFTAVVVSHDLPDIFYISNRIAIIDEGRIIFQGTPLELEQNRQEVVTAFLYSQEALQSELTGLDTRLELEEHFEDLMQGPLAPPVYTVLCFTIPELEWVREEIGNLAAQYVFDGFAKVVRRFISRVGFSGRWGLDRLVSVLPRVNREEALLLAQRIAPSLEGFNVLHGLQHPGVCFEVSVLVGAVASRPGADLKELVEEAAAKQEPLARLTCSGQP